MNRNRYVSFGGVLLFGKHNGELIEDVPSQYLRWMLAEVREEMNFSEKILLDEEIHRRGMAAGKQGRSDTHGHRDTGHGSSHGYKGSNGYQGSSSNPVPPTKLPVGITSADLLMVVAAGRQALAKRHHPDAGGDTRTMQRFNVAADWLEQSCRQVGGAK